MTTKTEVPKTFKICLVSISLAKGGAERSAALISRMLAASGHAVHVVVLNDWIDFEYAGKLYNLGTLRDAKDRPLNRLQRFQKLRAYLAKENFDVVVDHRSKNNYAKEVFYNSFIYKGIKNIYVIHSSKTESYFTKKPKKFARAYNNNVATVAVSNYIQEHIAKANGVTNCVTIHNAFDPQWLDTQASPAVAGDYILSYGRFDDSIKDFKFLMNAFTTSNLWKKNIYLVLLGGGNDEEMLKAYAATLPANKYIIFKPFTANPFGIIKAARCVTLTSHYEGFPMVLVESLALGTPVVSLDIVSGPSEIVIHRKNGLLIKERDEQKFSEALKTICTDEALYKTLKAATQSSVSQFSMAEISAKWNQLLHHVIS